MGRERGSALKSLGRRRSWGLGLLLWGVLWARPARAETHLEAAVASPFAELAGHFDLSEVWAVGGRLQLVDGRALRTGPTIALDWGWTGPLVPRTELFLGRAFGLSTRSTFDAQLTQELRHDLDPDAWVTLRLGLIGYLAPERPQTGVLAFGALRVTRTLGAGVTLGFELGWLASPHAHRPLLAIILGQAF